MWYKLMSIYDHRVSEAWQDGFHTNNGITRLWEFSCEGKMKKTVNVDMEGSGISSLVVVCHRG